MAQETIRGKGKKKKIKQGRDICKIEPVPSGGIDFSLIKVHNWFNGSKGTFAVKADTQLKAVLAPNGSQSLTFISHDILIVPLAKAGNIKASPSFASTPFLFCLMKERLTVWGR